MGTGGYSVADIFNRSREAFLKKYRVSSMHMKVMDSVQLCRTKALGGHVDACIDCGLVKVHYNSCGNRHCPTCQGANKEKWIYERSYDLLPVTYFHVVFTIPDLLHNLFRMNKRLLYNLLFKCSWETLREFSENPQNRLEAKIGGISILHTWTQKILYHPHVHIIVPGGGITKEGKWKQSPSQGEFLFHITALGNTFSGKFLYYLREMYDVNQLNVKLEHGRYLDKSEFISLVKRLKQKSWVVYSKPAFSTPERVLEYLGRYTHRVAISNYRIKKIENDRVVFTWRDREDNYKQKECDVSTVEFIRRFMEHVLPGRFVRIRHYGILSTRSKKEDLQKARKSLGVDVSHKKSKLTLKQVYPLCQPRLD